MRLLHHNIRKITASAGLALALAVLAPTLSGASGGGGANGTGEADQPYSDRVSVDTGVLAGVTWTIELARDWNEEYCLLVRDYSGDGRID